MKRDIVEFVAKCPNCQQVKYEHQRPGGTLQRMPIPEWKWERIAMDFVVELILLMSLSLPHYFLLIYVEMLRFRLVGSLT